MTLGKVLFLLFVCLWFVAAGILIGYILTRWISSLVAAHEIRKIKKQEIKKFENLYK